MDAFSWGANYIHPKDHVLKGIATFDPVLLEENLLKAPFMAKEKLFDLSNTIEIVKTADDGYQIRDLTKDLIHKDRAVMLVENAISAREESANLADGDVYESISLPAKEKDIKALFEKIKAFQSFKMTYDIAGETEKVDSSVTSDWITLDEDGTIHDPYHIEYLKAHVQQIRMAIEEGVDLMGYTMWSCIDLCAASTGQVSKRYGFIYVDIDDEGKGTLKRYKKDSFYWYKKVIASNGEELE